MEKGAGADAPPPFDILFSGTGAQGDSAVWIAACAAMTEGRAEIPGWQQWLQRWLMGSGRDAGVTPGHGEAVRPAHPP